MKRILNASLLTAAVLGLYNCTPKFKGITASVSPRPLEVHADSVKGTIRASIAPKKESGIAKGITYNGKVVIRNNADTLQKVQVSTVTMRYEDFPGVEQTGASRAVTFGAPYQDVMNPGTLLVESSYERKGKSFQLPNYTLGECCITTSRLLYTGSMGAGSDAAGMADTNRFKRFGDNYKATTPVYSEARFQFPKDVFKIQRDQYRREDIIAIGEFLKKGYTAKKISIQGFASPEGAFARNQMLSINRSREVQKWLIEQLKKNGYTAYLDSSFFVITTTSEDWEGFKANLDQTSYSEDIKRQIIEIVSAGYEEDEKERKIMALVGGANKVEKILAPLRRATIMMEAETKSRSIDVLAGIINGFIAGTVSEDSVRRALSQDEFLFVIRSQSSLENKIKLSEAYVRAYPDDYRGHNNLGAYYAYNNQKDKAYEAFSAANTKRANDPIILNNLSNIQMARGNWEDAYAFAEKSYQVQKSPEAAFVLGVREHKRANYTKAAAYFDEAKDVKGGRYNAGLAKLLSNDLAGSKSDLDAEVRANKENAWAHYVLAILGARSGDTNLMAVSLKQAVTLDATLATKAASDLEFRSYANSAEFKAAIAR